MPTTYYDAKTDSEHIVISINEAKANLRKRSGHTSSRLSASLTSSHLSASRSRKSRATEGLYSTMLQKMSTAVDLSSASLLLYTPPQHRTILIIMGLRSVAASEDVIGDPSRSGTNNSELLEPRREEREKLRKCWESGPASILTGQEKKRVAYGGKKCVFTPERNFYVGKEGQERSAIGNEFQIVGAAKVNERRPFAERMSGIL